MVNYPAGSSHGDMVAIKVTHSVHGGHKAKDAYGLDTTFLKTYKDSLVSPITHMVNLSFKQAVVPSAWNMATIVPIYKSGDKLNLKNYRPISILPIISKVAEKLVSNLLTNHLHKGINSLHPMQFGFR